MTKSVNDHMMTRFHFIRLMLVGHNTVPLSLNRSTVTASVRRPRVGGAGSAPL